MIDRRLRPRAFFAVAGACAPLVLAWVLTVNGNCHLGGGNTGACFLLGQPIVRAMTLLGLPAGVLGGLLALAVPESWLDAPGSWPGGSLFFDPSARTLAGVAVLLAGTAVLGPPLFYGTVTPDVRIWLALAVPFAAALAFWAGLFALEGLVEVGTGPAGLLLGATLLLVGALAQAGWFYLLAAGALGLGDAARVAVGDGPLTDGDADDAHDG